MVSIFIKLAGLAGIRPKEAERFFKFAIVGGIGFAVDFGVSNLLLTPLIQVFQASNSSFDPQTAAVVTSGTISFICAIISNFLWNRYWTYPDSRTKSFRRQFVQFGLVSIAGLVIRVPLLSLTTRPFTSFIAQIPSLSTYSVRIGANMALVVAVVIVMFWNFFVNRYWTYNDVSAA